MNICIAMPKPLVKVNRSRTVISRSAGTVSSSGPFGTRSTRGEANFGNHRRTSSSRATWPSVTSASINDAVSGFVVEAMRKMLSRATAPRRSPS